MTLNLRHKRWRIRECDLDDDTLGECDHQDTKGKEIRIRKGLTYPTHLYTLIHETLHACLPDISEDSVVESSAAITRVLHEFNYRRQEGTHPREF